MLRNSILLLLFSLVILTIGCGPDNVVTVREFSPKGEVPNLVTFTVEFTKPLAPPGKLNEWLSDEFIHFEPKIEGKFKWVADNTLIFSPDYPLESMQDYKAKITDKVLFNSHYMSDFETIEFRTPDFDAKKLELFWTNVEHQQYKLSVQGNLKFNYPVSPDQLKKFINVTRDGNDVPDYQIVTSTASDVIALNFGQVQQTDKEQEITIVVKKGLASVLGKKPLDEDRKFTQKLPPITKLEITGVTAGFDGATGWIEVATTQKVDESRLKEFIALYPERQFTYYVFENSFKLESDLTQDPTVTIKIKKGLPGLYGGILDDDFEQAVSMVNLDPSINFADRRGKYLMLSGNRNIEVNAVNMDGIELEVGKVFKNNLALFLGSYDWYNYDEGDEYYYNPSYYVGNYGQTLYTKEMYLTSSRNWLNRFTINLDSALKSKNKGVYVVTVRSLNDRWIEDSKLVAISDLGIIAKHSDKELVVFVNSIARAEPVEGVEISVVSTNNQTVFTGKTDGNGIVKFNDFKKGLGDYTPKIICAEKADDFNYIELSESLIETSRFDVGGVYEFSGNYNTFIYSDRNLYRPGETAYISGILRDEKMARPGDMPVITKILTPTGRVFEEYKSALNEEGSFELAVKIPAYAQTGEYLAMVYTGGDEVIASAKFSVEEFVPDKIRVMLSTDKDKAYPGESVQVGVNAEFLFGAKASNLRFESNVYLFHVPFISKKFPDFDFKTSSIKNENLQTYSQDGTLDGEGRGSINYQVPQGIKSSGFIIGKAFINVFDLTGRTVNRTKTFDIFTKDYFVGIKSPGYYFGVNQQMNFKIAAVNQDDKAINSFPATARLVRYEWQTVLKKNYDRYYYASEEKEIIEWQRDFNISDGLKSLPFAVTKSGKYELRIYKRDSEDYNSASFYAYGWNTATASSFEVNKEGRVEIVFDKTVYEPGNKAKVLFTCPFSGKMLVTIERNGILDYQYINIENRSGELTIPIHDEYMPNVYISATLFKKHTTDNSTPFMVGHGFASMKVEKKKNKLQLAINAPSKVKPKTIQTIEIRTAPEKDIFVTLAAVDEGILQIKNFKTPDPYGYMYSKRGLKVTSHDLYKLLLPEMVSMSGTPGGGEMELMDAEREKRLNPLASKRFKLLAFWSGIKRTNGSGVVRIPIQIPQFNGDVRLMAVAYSGARFGSAENHMLVADDIIIEPEIPRFLSTNDQLTAPVSLINTTKKQASVKVNMSVEGPMKINSQNSQSVTIPPNSSRQVIFKLATWQAVGQGKIKFETSGFAKVTDEIDISIKPASPLVTETGSGTIKAGGYVEIKMPGNFMGGTNTASLTISKFPAVKLAKHLKYLVGYPYGCLEQITSKAFPQLYFAEISKIISPESFQTNNPMVYVKEAIRKIESMQRYDGSIAYWEGADYTSWWGSVYAAHFLVEARKAGYEVSENALRKLLSYLEIEVKKQNTFDYVYYENGKRSIAKIAHKEIAYSLYVLALARRGDLATMNYYKARPNLLSNDSKYLLAGAYALMGKWSSYYSALPQSYKPERTDRLSGGSFDSEVRSNAIMLNVLLEVEPNNKQVPYMISHLSQMADKFESTQERSFAFLALGKAAKKTSSSNITMSISSNGKKIKDYQNKDLTIKSPELPWSNIQLKAQGSGEVYYFWSAQGVKINEKPKEEDAFIKVRREYFDFRTKTKIMNNNFQQGQLVLCSITLTGNGSPIENIVISDLIPSGFEIDNPRLAMSAKIDVKIENPMNIQYMDVRDDRLLLFTSLQNGGTKKFMYLMRVVNQGDFQLPPISAEAMYNPEIHSINGGGVVRVGPMKYM